MFGLRLTYFMLALLTIGMFVPGKTSADPICAAGEIGGTVFIDEDLDGVRDAADPDIPLATSGITISAYDDTNAVIATGTASGPNIGDYKITLPASVSTGDTVRVEFDIPPDGTDILYAPSRFPEGATQPFGTTVAFVEVAAAGNCGINQGVTVVRPGTVGTQDLNPFAGCADLVGDVDLYTSCFVFADGSFTTADPVAVVSFPFDAGVEHPTDRPFPDPANAPYSPYDAPPHPPEAYAGESGNITLANAVGAVYGTAYHRRSDSLFVSAYLKRHSAFGFGGPGAVYRVDRTKAVDDPTRYTLFATIPSAGADPHSVNTTRDDWRTDSAAFNLIGKQSLGDLDMDNAEENIYVVNLNDQSLYRIAIGSGEPSAGAPQNLGSLVTAVQGTNSACAAFPANEIRPFAIKVHLKQVYVGVTCTGEQTGVGTDPPTTGRDDVRFLVLRYDPDELDFTLILDFPLDSTNDPNYDYAPNLGDFLRARQFWRTWNDAFPGGCSGGFCGNPQPILADIEFDDNNDMILGFRDRWGDMTGLESFNPVDLTDNNTYSGIAYGDVLRACFDGEDASEPVFDDFTLEDNATCGGVTTGGANTLGGGGGLGPGGGGYYYEDYFFELTSGSILNIGFGGLANLPGSNQLVTTVQDPVPADGQTSDGGVIWLYNQGANAGQRARSYRVYNMNSNLPDEQLIAFGKANGLGDIEYNCPLNLEIGNYVWFDTDQDGIQDPNEVRAVGVTVNIYEDVNGNGQVDPGELVGTATTDANGQYIFNETNVNNGVYSGLVPFTNYLIVMNNPADFETGGALDGYFPTLSNVSGTNQSDLADSDGISEGWLGNTQFAAISMTTYGLGQNDHTWDFGFTQEIVETPEPPETEEPSGTTEPPGDDDDGGNDRDGGDGGDSSPGTSDVPETLEGVTELPRTGETPLWRRALFFVMSLGAGLAVGWTVWRTRQHT